MQKFPRLRAALGALAFLATATACTSHNEFSGFSIKPLPSKSYKATANPKGHLLNNVPDTAFEPLWARDGHIATSGFIAQRLGISDDKIKAFACYSQAPDDLAIRYSAPWVGVWGVIYIPYRRVIVNSLHSLHGGSNAAVQQRRVKLEALVRQSFLANDPEWQTGYLIHALGDSYAHVHIVNGQATSYGEWLGHALENLPGGEHPDAIFYGSNYLNYIAYVRALSRALAPLGDPSQRSQELLSIFEKNIKEQASKGEKADTSVLFHIPPLAQGATQYYLKDYNCDTAFAELDHHNVRKFLWWLSNELKP